MELSAYYFIPAGVMCTVLAIKLPALLRARRDPFIRSVCWVIFWGGAGFFFAAPSTISAVNEATGVANISGPLVYAIVMAYSASCLLLIIHWRGGPEEHIARLARRWKTAYATAIALLIILFVVGEAPTQRLLDFDTYFATTPWIGQMILLYLLGHMTAAVATTVLSWRWARQVHGWLKAGLWLLVVGFLLNLSFSGLKLTAVIARWTGHDWDVLSTVLAPRLAGLASALAALGFTLPLVGPWLVSLHHATRTWRRLGPLWHELAGARPGRRLAGPIPWYSSPFVRLTQREAGIQDGLNLLRPHFDGHVRTRAQYEAAAAGSPHEQAVAIGHAAMIADAVRRYRNGDTPPAECGAHPAGTPNSPAAFAGIAHALSTSRIVEKIRTTAETPHTRRTNETSYEAVHPPEAANGV
jgi:hypothetical protein